MYVTDLTTAVFTVYHLFKSLIPSSNTGIDTKHNLLLLKCTYERSSFKLAKYPDLLSYGANKSHAKAFVYPPSFYQPRAMQKTFR